MSGFLVRRPPSSDKHKVPFDIGAFIVNANSEEEAVAAAATLARKFMGPVDAAYVNSWTAYETSSSDYNNGEVFLNAVLQGDVIIPGEMLRGGGIKV